MVRKDDADDRTVRRQGDLKRITLHLAGNRAGDRKARVHLCHTILNTSEFLYTP